VIDLSNVKAPGWQRVVAELSASAADDRAYFERVMRVLAQASAARQAVLFTPTAGEGDEIEPKVDAVFPPVDRGPAPESESAPDAAGIEHAREAKDAARAAFGSNQCRAFSLDKQDLYYEGGGNTGLGTLLAVPLPAPLQELSSGDFRQGVALGVVTLLIEPRSREAVRSTLAMAEVLAGYVHGHGARSALKRARTSAGAMELATRLIASINTAASFKGACLQLCNDLAKEFAVDRACLGWVRGDTVRVQAMSDVEHFERRTAMVQKIADAMDESLDQEQAVLYPQPPGEGPGGDVLLSQTIVHAHRILAAGTVKTRILSVPLRLDEEIVGVVLLETTGDAPLDSLAVELLQSAMDLVAPVMKVRRSDDRNLALRTYDTALRSAAWAVGPRHTVWKLVGVAVFALAMVVTFVRTTYYVGADATLEPRVRRIVSAPFDGLVQKLGEGVEPGKDVAAGQLLVQLDTTELRLALSDAEGKILQAQKQAAAARLERDQGKVRQAELQEERARAEAETYRSRIEKSSLTAPFAGTIIVGEVKDKVGATVKLGDVLLQLAPLDDIVMTAKVDERDIAMVRRAFAENRASGEIATKGAPGEPLKFEVERIVPMASAVDGKNVFEVKARIAEAPEKLRAFRLVVGMEGRANFATERRALWWIGTRRIVETIRMWLW
jgi:multidrug efflux pump subunit AcrA (membrane-fusion protein)